MNQLSVKISYFLLVDTYSTDFKTMSPLMPNSPSALNVPFPTCILKSQMMPLAPACAKTFIPHLWGLFFIILYQGSIFLEANASHC